VNENPHLLFSGGLPRNRCPICGHEFDEVKAVNVCPTIHYGEQEFTPDDLITDDDDYAWCI
jgi:rubredoxin